MHMTKRALPPAPPGAPSALPLQPGHATPVSARVSMLRDDDRCVYFLNTDPVCAHAADDRRGRNLCLGRLALFGLATQSELARAHGISQSTVSRARQRLEQRGESGFVGPRKQRRRHGSEDPELLARAARMLEAGRSVYGVAKELGVSSSTLWRYTREGRLPASQCPARRAASAPEPGGPATPGLAAEPAGTADTFAEAVAGPAAELAGESVAEPAPGPAGEAGGRSAAGPATGPGREGAEESVREAPGERAEGPVAEAVAEAVAEPAAEPAGESVAEAVAEAAGGPVAQPAGPQPVTTAAPGKEERNRRDAAAAMGRGARDTAGRVAASVGALDGRQPSFESASAVSGGGVLAALPALLRAGLLRRASLLELPKGFYGLPSLLLLWAFLLLARLRNPERLGYSDPGEWGALPGLDRCPCPRTLRRRTRQLAACEGLPAWIGSLALSLIHI